jgi:predicted metal-binding protein
MFSGAYDYLPKKNIGHYSEDNFKKVISWQLKRLKNGKGNNILIIFDDVMNLTDEFKKNLFRKLISEYRHFKISFIFSVQYIKGVNPIFRECTRYVSFFYSINNKSIESLYENFMQDKKNKKEVVNFIKRNLTKPYQFLFIDNYASENYKYKVIIINGENRRYKIKF